MRNLVRLMVLCSAMLSTGCGVIRRLVMLIVVCFAMLSTGCASMMGIYESEYGCPQSEDGRCMPVDEANMSAIADGYGGSANAAGKGKETVISDFRPDPAEEEEFLIKEVGDFKAVLAEYEKCLKKQSAAQCEEQRDKLMEQYRAAEDRGRAKELHGLNMQERVAQMAVMEAVVNGGSNTIPIREPDTIMEVTVLPYSTGFGALASERVLWVVVQEGKWRWATSEGKPGAKSKLGATN